MVPSPGISEDHMLLVEAAKLGISIKSEVDLALENYEGRVVGVTGTNGKSTTVSLIGHLLNQLNVGATVAGNIGDPPSAQIAEGRVGEVLVLELSSYQLEQSSPISTDVAVFTSLSEDHLAYHKSFERYFEAKKKLILATKSGGLALLCPEAFFR